MKNGKPLIGLTSGYMKNDTADMVYLNHSYLDAIRHFGGIPLILPVEGETDELEALVNLCDGIILTGGEDVDPSLYGQELWSDSVVYMPKRDDGERWICNLAVSRNLPILGICRGIQMMNVYFGGTLIQDIPTQVNTEIQHRMEKPFHRNLSQLHPGAGSAPGSGQHRCQQPPSPGDPGSCFRLPGDGPQRRWHHRSHLGSQ